MSTAKGRKDSQVVKKGDAKSSRAKSLGDLALEADIPWIELMQRGPRYINIVNPQLHPAYNAMIKRLDYIRQYCLPEMSEWSFHDILHGPPIMFQSDSYGKTRYLEVFVYELKRRQSIYTAFDAKLRDTVKEYVEFLGNLERRVTEDRKKSLSYCEFQANLSNDTECSWEQIPDYVSRKKKEEILEMATKRKQLMGWTTEKVKSLLTDSATDAIRSGNYPNVLSEYPGDHEYRLYLQDKLELPNFYAHSSISASVSSKMRFSERRSSLHHNLKPTKEIIAQLAATRENYPSAPPSPSPTPSSSSSSSSDSDDQSEKGPEKSTQDSDEDKDSDKSSDASKGARPVPAPGRVRKLGVSAKDRPRFE